MNACSREKQTLFSLTEPSDTGILFENNVPYTEDYNTYTYRNFYNGGGVALGDINNDGLLDIYFTGNIADNKLFINKGNWKFEDITHQAGVACHGVWSTGATMVDINGDGWLDIYVCKAGKPGGSNRANELFINQGNLTFKERAKEYGLDVIGLSIHSAFFDYDRDGDLDCYILNNSLRSVGGFDLVEGQREIRDPEGNKFFKNEGGKFVEITEQAGIYSSNIGYGLGITVSDFNGDDYADIFISNDFFERDYLYINNQNGTFKEIGTSAFPSMSMGSMGADATDLDNDLQPDLFVTEMLPRTLERKKTKTQYETWDKQQAAFIKGYHHQFPRNALHKNIGKNRFLEVGRIAGVSDTEWSWASLSQDFDNDGLKDLFVSNGLFKDLLDKDYLNYSANANMIRSKIQNREKVLTMLVDSMPSKPVKNCMFRNMGDMAFEMVSDQWGLGQETFSNGSAYGDLDNDGDLDLVVNNVNMPSYVYRNNLDTSKYKSIGLKLKGKDQNSHGVGAKVVLKYKNGQSFIENYTSKGFESSIDPKIHIGVGNIEKIDSVFITWPDGSRQFLINLKSNKTYNIQQEIQGNAQHISIDSKAATKCDQNYINFVHKDVDFNLFTMDRLMAEMPGFDGPGLAVADVNHDGQDDVFVGGGKNQASKLFLSNGNNYISIAQPFDQDSKSECVKAQFFDIDNDNDLDLYVANGGKMFSNFSPELNDVLYINDGHGKFIKSKQLPFSTPINTGDFAISDLNHDGWADIVVVEKMKNDFYTQPGSLHILYNLGNNNFKYVMPTSTSDLGMITSVALIDINDDSYDDIVMAGKWMPITILQSKDGNFMDSKPKVVAKSSGLWNTLYAFDLDQDGDKDLVAGNEGLNTFYSNDMKMCVNDYDANGSLDQIMCKKIDGKEYPIHDLDELYSQLPMLKKKFTKYKDFAKADMATLFGKEALENAKIFTLEALENAIFINDKNHLSKISLPRSQQYSSVHAIFAKPIKEGILLYLGGNHYKVKPQYGRQDGSLGWKLVYSPKQNHQFTKSEPLYVEGQIRTILPFENKIILGINNAKVQICDQ